MVNSVRMHVVVEERREERGERREERQLLTVVFGSLILMITALKRLGLYSAFLACSAIS